MVISKDSCVDFVDKTFDLAEILYKSLYKELLNLVEVIENFNNVNKAPKFSILPEYIKMIE